MEKGCPFRLSEAPSTFQRMMAVILGDSQYKEALCYLDDILIWGRIWEKDMSRLRVVLEKMTGVVLSPSKCILELDELNTWDM